MNAVLCWKCSKLTIKTWESHLMWFCYFIVNLEHNIKCNIKLPYLVFLLQLRKDGCLLGLFTRFSISFSESSEVVAYSCSRKIMLFWKWNTYNPGRNFWKRIEKSSNIRQEEKSLIFTFACFLTVIAKV